MTLPADTETVAGDRKLHVYIAQPYDSSRTGSLGDAAGMLVRQHNFPHEYSTLDEIITADHDRILAWRSREFRAVLDHHIHTWGMGIGSWVRRATVNGVMAFLQDALQVGIIHTFPDGKSAPWTGFRVLISVNRGNGYPVFTMQLFAKHPDTTTKGYSGERAPNVRHEVLTVDKDRRGRGGRRFCIYDNPTGEDDG